MSQNTAPCPHCGYQPVTTEQAIKMLKEVDPTGKREILLTGYKNGIAKPMLIARLDQFVHNGKGVVYLFPTGGNEYNL